MITGVRQKTVVGEGGRVELLSPELPRGTLVDVIVLVDSADQDTTEYLISTEANRKHLLQALHDLDDRSTYTHVKPSDL